MLNPFGYGTERNVEDMPYHTIGDARTYTELSLSSYRPEISREKGDLDPVFFQSLRLIEFKDSVEGIRFIGQSPTNH
jgi:hypothetical protein